MTRYPLPIFVQRFFAERLTNQLAASANTMASYRDTFRLLLNFATTRIGRQPTDPLVTDIDAGLVGGCAGAVAPRCLQEVEEPSDLSR